MSQYEENLKTFSVYHPINIDLINKAQDLPEDALESFDPIDFDDLAAYEGIFAYGLQTGSWIESLCVWLDTDEKRRLIVLENDPRVFKRFLKSEKAEKLISKKGLHFILAPTGLEASQDMILKEMIKFLVSIFHLHRTIFLEHPEVKDITLARQESYEDAIQKGLSDFYYYDQILRGQQHKTLINIFENLTIHQDMILIDELKGKFKNTPIVLCGAGFSLPKIYDKLKEIQSHTLIAAAGTASSLLFKNKIYAQFTGILDVSPHAQLTPFYQTMFGAVFYLLRSGCYSVMQHQGFKVVCDTKLEIPLIQDLLKDKLNENRDIFSYWTVTDFLLQQLIHLGFGPIYLCGADHILDKQNYYGEMPLKSLGTYEPCCKATNINQETVYTKFDWQQGTKSISKIAEAHKETQIIYVSDSGLPIKHVKTISTDEFKNIEFNKQSLSEDIFLPKFLEAQPAKIEIEQLQTYISEIMTSLEACLDIMHKVNISLGQTFSAWQIFPIDLLNPYQGVFFDLQAKLQEQKAYQLYLEPTWRIFKQQLHSDAGYYGEGSKAKLTLFALKTRELDFMKNHAVTLHTLLSLQQKQLEERQKKTSLKQEDALI